MVYNRTARKAQELVAMGARQANSPKEVAENSEIIITMVADSPEVEQVILGPAGVIEGAKPGSVIVDMSSISPIVTQRIAAELAKRNAGCSGQRRRDETAFNEVKPGLEKMGKSACSAQGKGQKDHSVIFTLIEQMAGMNR